MCAIPTQAEIAGFAADYERARATPFSQKERELAHAILAWLAEHGDAS